MIEEEDINAYLGEDAYCEYSYDYGDQLLWIYISPEDNADYTPDTNLRLKSVFMEPWTQHYEFIFHEKFDDEEDLEIC